MCALQGKGIWTLYDDVATAVACAPDAGAKYILCKVSQHGRYSPQAAHTALLLVRTNLDLVPVAWTYSYLDDIDGEVECLRRALEDGFEAFVIDAEVDLNLKFEQARQYASKVQQLGVDLSRIYLCSDPRLDNKIDEIPFAALAPICKGGFLPMIYGEIMPAARSQAAASIMKMAYDQYERHKAALGYTLPLMPVIASYWDNQGKARMNYAEFQQWCSQAESRMPTFISLYRAGVTTPEAWQAFKELQISGSVIIDKNIYIEPGGPGYYEFFYPPALPSSGWHEFIDHSGHLTRYRLTSNRQTMYVSYLPALSDAGRYVIEVFIPNVHATTREAQYFVLHHPNGETRETSTVINQLSYSDHWVPLGTFDLDPAHPESGRVNLVDMTADSSPKEIAFSAIRWRPVVQGVQGFDSPVGTDEERASAQVWPGSWRDANPYLSKYDLGYHTGSDLNLNYPYWDADRGKPVYAVCDGEVTFAEKVRGSTWGGLVVIRHAQLPDGKPVYSRYGHVEKILVKPGDTVRRGQQLAQVGPFTYTSGATNYHLHFDISTSEILLNSPRHWPGFNRDEIIKNYVDPRKFIEDHRP